MQTPSTSTNDIPDHCIDVTPNGDIYVAGVTTGPRGYNIVIVKYNTSGNQQWIYTYNGTGNGEDRPRVIRVDPQGNVYVAGFSYGNGSDVDYILLKLNSPTIVSRLSMNIPNYFYLSQNYPNPFNPTTKIKFDLPKSGLVILKVFNELGKELETLVNEQLSPGTYETEWNATNYPSGIYFYRLQTEAYNETQKMILIK